MLTATFASASPIAASNANHHAEGVNWPFAPGTVVYQVVLDRSEYQIETEGDDSLLIRNLGI